MILFYQDPKKRALQIAEIVALVVMLPMALMWGSKAYARYAQVVESERYFDRGHMLMHESDWKGAVAAFDQCLTVNPEYFPAYEARADIFYTEFKDIKKAIQSLEDGITRSGDPRLRMELGEYYLYAKQYTKAREQLLLASQGMPDNLTCKGLLKQADDKLNKSTL